MKIHEYQAKELLKRYGLNVPKGRVATTPNEAADGAREIGGSGWVLKAQIHAGGRGKAGGILTASSLNEVREAATRLLGSPLRTTQSGPEGLEVKKVLVEEMVPVARELYAGVIVDRSKGRGLILVSPSGGVEIETLAEQRPELIFREWLEPWGELSAFKARRVCFALGLDAQVRPKMETFLKGLSRMFYEEDCTLAEVNPLVITLSGEVLALDAKVNLDDNASFRHPEWSDLRDPSQEDPIELEASRYGLNYVRLKGTIGCMVNGAGLAMATMDMIKQAGAEPANFLDVGGGASQEAVSRAFGLLLRDPGVKVVLINIFGGIMRGDVIARGIVDAASTLEIKVPLVVRLSGTNAQEGRRILEQSGLRIHGAETMREAAEIACRLGGVDGYFGG